MLKRSENPSAPVERRARLNGGARLAGACVAVALCMALGACAVAPGMRMSQSQRATQEASPEGSPEETAASGGTSTLVVDATASTPEIPVTELDVALVKSLQEDRLKLHQQQIDLLSAVPQPYSIGAGDVLQIVVWDHPEIAAGMGTAQNQASTRPGDPFSGFVVDQSGDLTFPYAGTLHVAGLRIEEVQRRLIAVLSRYFVKPQVTVRMASYRAHEVYVDGEVRNPGVVAVNDVPMSLYEAISRAGGFSDTADQSDIALVRGGESHRSSGDQDHCQPQFDHG